MTASAPVLLAQFLSSSGTVHDLPRRPEGGCRDDRGCPDDWQCQGGGCAPPQCQRESPAEDDWCTEQGGYLATCADWGLGDYYCLASADPAMLLVPPAEQHRRDYVFLAPLDYQIDFINLTAPAGSVVELDGRPVEGWERLGALGGTDWQVVTLVVSDGRHQLTSRARFGLTVYGYDRDVSYAYPGGLDLARINN